MGKSLDFVKKEVDLKKNCFEFGADKVFDYLFYKEKCGENLWSLEFTRPDTREKFEVKIKYDPEADFDGWFGDRCICDGTFSHYLELSKRNLIRIGKYELERKNGFWILDVLTSEVLQCSVMKESGVNQKELS